MAEHVSSVSYLHEKRKRKIWRKKLKNDLYFKKILRKNALKSIQEVFLR